MSDNRRIIEICLDVESNSRRILSEGILSDPPSLSIFRGTQVLFRTHLLRSDGVTYFKPELDAVWLFGLDDSYAADKADLVSSSIEDFNINEDWPAGEDGHHLDIVNGKICWRVDLTSNALKSSLADAASKTIYAALWMCPVGGRYTLMAHWDVVLRNVAVDPTTAIPQEGISFVTMDLHEADRNQILVPTGGLYRYKNGALQLKNTTISKFKTCWLEGTDDASQLKFGPGED